MRRSASMSSHIEADTKWLSISWWHFQMYFLECKYIDFDWNVIELYSQGSNQKYSIIISDNGFVLVRQQAIIWNNHVLVYWTIYASLSLNELIITACLLNMDHEQKVVIEIGPRSDGQWVITMIRIFHMTRNGEMWYMLWIMNRIIQINSIAHQHIKR